MYKSTIDIDSKNINDKVKTIINMVKELQVSLPKDNRLKRVKILLKKVRLLHTTPNPTTFNDRKSYIKATNGMYPIKLYFDGGCKNNNIGGNGFSGTYGSFAIFQKDNEIYRINKEPFPDGSSNFAEAKACTLGLEKCLSLGHKKVLIFGDSKIILNRINAMNRGRAIVGTGTELLAKQCMELGEIMQQMEISTEWIPRTDIMKILGH